jgi:hypothetical protein
MELENIVLSEASQVQKDKGQRSHGFSYIEDRFKYKYRHYIYIYIYMFPIARLPEENRRRKEKRMIE